MASSGQAGRHGLGSKVMAIVQDETGSLTRHIARVAARLFAERGYEATPVRVIAEEAGVAKPTLYHHFGSKEALAQALVTDPLERLADVLGGLLDAPHPPVRRLEAMAEAYFAFSREDPDRARFVYGLFFGPGGSALVAELARHADALNRALASAVGRLAEAGLVAPGRSADCTKAFRGLLLLHTTDFLYRGEEFAPGLARRLVGDLIRGFGGPAGRRAVGTSPVDTAP